MSFTSVHFLLEHNLMNRLYMYTSVRTQSKDRLYMYTSFRTQSNESFVHVHFF